MTLLITLFLFLDVHSIPSCEFTTPPLYTKFQKQYNEYFKKAANSPPISSIADQTLTKLVNAKSPAIINWISKPEHRGKNNKQIQSLWRQYYLNFFILNSYPNKNTSANAYIEKYVDDIVTQSIPKKKLKEIQDSFTQAKKLSLQTLQQMSIPKPSKTEILKRISEIELKVPVPFKNFNIKSALDVVSWSVNYDPVPNRINIGLEVLKYPNKQTLVSVFAHEIAHAFDPCRYKAFMRSKNPFTGVYSCLRSSDSIQAKNRDDSQLEAYLAKQKISQEQALGMKLSPNCNKSYWPPAGKQKDQLSEVFADWFSAEVMSNFDGLDKSLRADLCENRKLASGSSYVSNYLRLNGIYYAHPKIANQLKVKSTKKYCAL